MTAMRNQRPAWQLPRGVCSGTWDYLVEPAIATEYDAFHGPHPLMKLDTELLLEHLQGKIPAQTIVADFGCGTARIARRLETLGFRTLSVDLSSHMLRTAQQTLAIEELNSCVHSNLVELQWLRDETLDCAVCLFSSLGMIQGRQHRLEFLRHVCRALKPGGKLLVHVHNRGRSWLDPQGPRWLVSGWFKSILGRQSELGDRVYTYRGLPRMFLHIFSQSELRQDLLSAGFCNLDIQAIDVTGGRLLPRNACCTYLRAGGFFAWATAQA